MPVLQNSRHERFAQAVASGSSQTRAYVDAGYSEKTARSRSSVLATKYPDVSDRIRELIEERVRQSEEATRIATERLAIDRAWVLGQLVDSVASAKVKVPVLDRNGIQVGEYCRDLTAANKALELIGKELGMFVERKVHTQSPFDALSLDEKRALLDVLLKV